MEEKVKQRNLYCFDCCDDGLPINGRKINNQLISPHYFLVLSNDIYNKNSIKFITAIPCTSKINKLSTQWYLHKIEESDVRNYQPSSGLLSKQTYLLTDRPCRLSKEMIKDVNSCGEVHFSKYKEIVDKIRRFMLDADVA